MCPLLRGVDYWEVILKRLSHLRINILSAIHDMSAIWDVCYWEVSLYNKTTGIMLYIGQITTHQFTKILSRSCQFPTW